MVYYEYTEVLTPNDIKKAKELAEIEYKNQVDIINSENRQVTSFEKFQAWLIQLSDSVSQSSKTIYLVFTELLSSIGVGVKLELLKQLNSS